MVICALKQTKSSSRYGANNSNYLIVKMYKPVAPQQHVPVMIHVWLLHGFCSGSFEQVFNRGIQQLKCENLPGFSNREAFTWKQALENQEYLQLILTTEPNSRFQWLWLWAKSVEGICCRGSWCCTAAMLALVPLLSFPLPGTSRETLGTMETPVRQIRSHI